MSAIRASGNGSVANRLVIILLAPLLLLASAPRGVDAQEPPPTPILVAVEPELTRDSNGDDQVKLRIRWEVVGERVNGLQLLVYDASGAYMFTAFESLPTGELLDVAGVHDLATASLKPNTRYCIGLKAWVGRDASKAVYSEESAHECVTVVGRPNLGVSEIRGKEDLDWATPNSRNPVYILMLRNDGGDATDRVVVEIKTSGVVTLADQLPILVQGWESQGFTCERTAVSGGANAGMLCTGGTLKHGQDFNPGILTRVTGRGFGHVHVVVNVTRGRGDSDFGDNSLTLNVQVS